MAVTTAYTPSELQEAARIGGHDVAATTTPEIEITRKTTALPLVNIDAFIFPRKVPKEGTEASSKFETAAFLQRLIDVGRPRIRRLPPDREISTKPEAIL
jgi:hypothetical protein